MSSKVNTNVSINNLYVLSGETLKKNLFELIEESSKKNLGVVMPIEFVKHTFGGNLSEGGNYTKATYAVAELIDNAIGANRGRGVSKRIDLFINANSDNSVSTRCLNAGKGFPDKAMQKYGDSTKEECEHSFNTGLKHAVSILGMKSAYVATNRKDGCFGFDLTTWTKGSRKITLDKTQWPYDEKAVTTDIEMTTDDPTICAQLLEISKNPVILGSFYWSRLKNDKDFVLYLNDTRVTPCPIYGKEDFSRIDTLNINGVLISARVSQFKMDDSKEAKDAKYFGKNLRCQGISIYANGRFIEHSGVAKIVHGKKGGQITDHPVFNQYITIVDILFNKSHREADLPFASNNKASIDWASDIGEKYREQLDKNIGDVYRQLHYNERERRDRADIDYYMTQSLAEITIDACQLALAREIVLPGYEFRLDLALGESELEADGMTPKTSDVEVFDEDGNAVIKKLRVLDFTKIGVVYEFSGRYKDLTPSKIYALMDKVMAVKDITGKTPSGVLYCRGDKNTKSIIQAKKNYYKIVGKEITITPFRYGAYPAE